MAYRALWSAQLCTYHATRSPGGYDDCNRISNDPIQFLCESSRDAPKMKEGGGPPEFDAFAENYDDALAKGLEISGEKKDFFAEGRTRFLSDLFEDLQFKP